MFIYTHTYIYLVHNTKHVTSTDVCDSLLVLTDGVRVRRLPGVITVDMLHTYFYFYIPTT